MVKFRCYGHKNITAKHGTTFEFTRDEHVTLNGDCIIGIGAEFDYNKIMRLLNYSRLRIRLHVGEHIEDVYCKVNKNFDCKDEIVVRLGSYDSERTLGIHADKASRHLNREIMDMMKESGQMMVVEIVGIDDESEDLV